MTLTRRSLLLTGSLGLGALALPGAAAAAAGLADRRGFTHAVASGEPAADAMLFWTRWVPAGGDAATLVLEVSESPDFARVVAGGQAVTGPWRDWTVKVTAGGLRPGTDYHYRFVAPDGSRSPVGRTRTLPGNGARAFRAAIFSCSNLGYGWFNAYGHAAARGDLDCAIHLGDYFYEYGPNHYPEDKDVVAARVPEPLAETVHLADYRLRYASYRADPDLQALHARLPMIAQWDDHESANDSWEGGAENHDARTQGDWTVRKAAAMQAYREWMPVGEAPWATYDVGDLATIFRTETRLAARTRQNTLAKVLAGHMGDPAAALTRFRDGAWADPAATMMGTTQERWIADAMRRSVREGRRWQVVGFGTNFGTIRTPAELAGLAAPGRYQARLEAAVLAGKLGLPANLDAWDGYPAARRRFLADVRAAGAELVIVTGDSHNAWAFDLQQDGAAGVEFGGHSVTSPGYESSLAVPPPALARALVGASPELRWCDTSRRGYMALTIEPERVTNEWLFVDTVRERRPAATVGHRATVRRGRRRMEA
jgi:alkaline phosphatase D